MKSKLSDKGKGMKTILVLMSFFVFASLASAELAKAINVSGADGEVMRIRKFKREAVKQDDELQKKDIIYTKGKGTATILLPDGSKVSVGANSRLKLSKYFESQSAKDKNQVIELFHGIGKFDVKSLPGKPDHFKVKTPVAVVGVRGTKFLVDHKPPQRGREAKSSVSVVQGKVAMSAVRFTGTTVSKPIVVQRLESSSVSGETPPTPPQQISLGQLNRIEASAGLETSTQQDTLDTPPPGQPGQGPGPGQQPPTPGPGDPNQQQGDPNDPQNQNGATGTPDPNLQDGLTPQQRREKISSLIQDQRILKDLIKLEGVGGPSTSVPPKFDTQKLNETVLKRRIGRPAAPPSR